MLINQIMEVHKLEKEAMMMAISEDKGGTMEVAKFNGEKVQEGISKALQYLEIPRSAKIFMGEY